MLTLMVRKCESCRSGRRRLGRCTQRRGVTACGFGGRITLIGEERHRPYDRPPLSKGVLLGETDSTVVDSDLDALEVDFHAGVSAKGLHPGVVETTEGELAYEGLVIATGARPIRLRGDGPQHVVRTIDDALRLRSLLGRGRGSP